MEPGESLIDAVKREAREETSVEVEVGSVAFVYEYEPIRNDFVYGNVPSIGVTFACKRVSGSLPRMPEKPDSHQVGVRWVPLTELKSVQLYPDYVIIEPHQSEWSLLFQGIAQLLRAELGEVATRIDHIGSTSIPGLNAKPIIDIQISVLSFEPFDVIRNPLERCGFRWRSDNLDITKRYFREAPGNRRTHIHVRKEGSWSQQFALLFRDYMRCHPEDCVAYAALKVRLAKQYGADRHGYVDTKEPFIWSVMQKADQWSQTIGWTLTERDK